MSRRRRAEPREIAADPVYNSTLVEKFINSMMWDGKKAVSQNIFYAAMDTIRERSGDDPLKLFKKAVENAKPLLEVKTRRVGGANYQVPIEVPQNRRTSLALRWLILNARSRPEKGMADKAGRRVERRRESCAAARLRRRMTSTVWPRPTRPSPTTGGRRRSPVSRGPELARCYATYGTTRENAQYRHHGPHRCR